MATDHGDPASFPARYEPVKRLGKGGGGEVWSARDRVTDRIMALKILRDSADEPEMQALVREATLLSGIEELGVPRVLHFGRLPKSDRAYMVRELVEGQSLADILDEGGSTTRCLSAVAQAADLVTRLHRSLLLHGDIKPANIIVGPDGTATLVDLGLAAPWQEGGTKPEGLTPRYAAPELFRAEPLTPRAEVFALGATLADVMARTKTSVSEDIRDQVQAVADRATEEAASARYPSADEFAEALRRAAKLPAPDHDAQRRVWSIVGVDTASEQLLDQVRDLDAGAGLVIAGNKGSGRTTLLRRVAWSLGVEGAAVLLVDEEARNLELCLEVGLEGREPSDIVILVDDADRRSPEELAGLDALRREGAKLVAVVAPSGQSKLPGPTFQLFQIPPLAGEEAEALVHRMIPSLDEKLVRYIVARAGGLPGLMRAMVERLEGVAVVSVEDVERQLSEVPVPSGVRIEPTEIQRLLERGLFDQAADYLEAYQGDESVTVGLLRAKLATGRGEPHQALEELKRIGSHLDDEGDEKARWHVEKARAHLRTGDYDDAETHAGLALTRLGASLLGEVASGNLGVAQDDGSMTAMVSEALAISGIAQSLSARHDQATRTLRRSVEVARGSGDARVLAVALGSLAFALQRNDKLDEAQAANEEALELAQQAGDAGHVATTRLNLAGIARMRGDVATAIRHLEAAVDMGRRSGRQSTVRQALLNLANLDIYLGRLARAQGSIDALASERDSLGAVQQAQLYALEAEAAALSGDFDSATQKCSACGDAYEKLRRPVDAAEALLERVLFEVQDPAPDIAALQETLFRAEALLADSGAHRPLLLQSRGQVARLAGEIDQARTAFDEAIDSARETRQQEWLWRALAARAKLHREQGDDDEAEKDRRQALEVLEQIASELPRDLREVYWHEPRRRALMRPRAETAISPSGRKQAAADLDFDAPTQLGGMVREDRLARVLEINHAIAGEYDLDRLLDKIADHAIALLFAERGFVLLKSESGEDRLSIHAARDRHGDDPHARFSRSIAERVVQTGDPFIAVDAGRDERVGDYVSVHSLMLKSVACVPIHSRGEVIGALYLETRMRPGALFDDELPTLTALADQSAIAIENARLINENKQRAAELEKTNAELEKAHKKLEELLGRRTEQLQNTRRDLKSAKELLRGHFGYQGIVGTSNAMRKVYAIVDRVKDADVPVLITGESGTGKEVIARAIHNAGPRGKKKFVGVNCGAIPEHLLESELFGHVRGAFTGADRDKKGLFRELSEGTILLDEIGEMPQKMQAGLLRVLQEKVVRPVGGTREEEVGTRVIAATHRDLALMVQENSFREDLYYRLNVIQLRVPALRERLEDIPLLIDHFLRLFAARYKRDKRKVGREALKRLMDYAWPGNVRQLENVLLNAWILSDEPELGPDDFELPEPRVSASGTARAGLSATSEVRARRPENVDDAEQREKEEILEALNTTNWNRAKAAKLIGMPRRTFYRRLKKYDIQ